MEYDLDDISNRVEKLVERIRSAEWLREEFDMDNHRGHGMRINMISILESYVSETHMLSEELHKVIYHHTLIGHEHLLEKYPYVSSTVRTNLNEKLKGLRGVIQLYRKIIKERKE